MAFWNVPPLFYVASKVFVKSCCFVSPLWRCLCGLWFLAYPVLPGSSTQRALGSFEDPLALCPCPVHFAADPGSYPFPWASFCISEGWRIKTGLKTTAFVLSISLWLGGDEGWWWVAWVGVSESLCWPFLSVLGLILFPWCSPCQLMSPNLSLFLYTFIKIHNSLIYKLTVHKCIHCYSHK